MMCNAEVTPKRNFYHSGHNLPIRIETSDRPSHQLVSRVLRILLLDVLGYSKVELVGGEASIDATRALNRFTRYAVALKFSSNWSVNYSQFSQYSVTFINFNGTDFSLA